MGALSPVLHPVTDVDPAVLVDERHEQRLSRGIARRYGLAVGEVSRPAALRARYYLNRTEVDFTCLTPADTVTACPYKGSTSGYWTARVNGKTHRNIAWSYDFPTLPLLPIAGLVAFYNERVDIVLDRQRLARPTTHFS